jgi:2-polyprenyl-3-methyl-5-hydroxy-6-metoxy-1,4-benzoquinol methylase
MDPMEQQSYGKTSLNYIDKLTIRARLKHAHRTIQLALRNRGNYKLKVIEVGCGFDGKNLISLADEFPNVLFEGFDLEVNENFNHPRISLTRADLNTAMLADQRADIILSLAVIEHLHNPLQHLSLLRSLCKDQAVIVFTTPAPQLHPLWSFLRNNRLIHEDQHHISYLTKEGIFEFARMANLQILEFRPFQMGLNQFALFSPKILK